MPNYDQTSWPFIRDVLKPILKNHARNLVHFMRVHRGEWGAVQFENMDDSIPNNAVKIVLEEYNRIKYGQAPGQRPAPMQVSLERCAKELLEKIGDAFNKADITKEVLKRHAGLTEDERNKNPDWKQLKNYLIALDEKVLDEMFAGRSK